MTFLLRMKTWLLFTLLVLPVLFEILVVATAGFSFIADEGIEQDEFLFSSIIFFILFVIAAIMSMVILLSWLYAVATRLYPKLPEGHQLKIGRFRFAFFFPVIYIIAFTGLIFVMVSTESPEWIFIILPFHLFAMVCMFYVFYYTAKSLKSVELQRPVKFADYAGEFFMIWIFFIGVWVIQPRINKIFADDGPSEYGGPVDRYLK